MSSVRLPGSPSLTLTEEGKMLKLAILIPVLRRPQNIVPLLQSIQKNTPIPHETIFIASPSDKDEITALIEYGAIYMIMPEDFEGRGDYARKINTGFRVVEAEWYFTGADDLRFHPGWFGAAMQTYERSGSCVIGTNDLGNPLVKSGHHSTHSLVLGEYIQECGTIDEPGKVLHEGYPHEFVDTELIDTAKWRGAWSFSANSRVEHLHPNWGKGSMDSLYAAQPQRMIQGRQIYERRKLLWK